MTFHSFAARSFLKRHFAALPGNNALKKSKATDLIRIKDFASVQVCLFSICSCKQV